MRKDAVRESDNRGNFRHRWSDYESDDVNSVRDFANQKKKNQCKKKKIKVTDFKVAAKILKTNLCWCLSLIDF